MAACTLRLASGGSFLIALAATGRIIVWFPRDDRNPAAIAERARVAPPTVDVVVAVLGIDRAQMGDVFYDSVGTRADQALDRFLARLEAEG